MRPYFRKSATEWLSAMHVIALLACGVPTLGLTQQHAPPTTVQIVTHTGSPVIDAEITIDGSRVIRSDLAGRFSLSGAAIGQVRLQVRALGFTPLDTLLTLLAGDDVAVLRLTQHAQQLAPVVTEAVLPYGKPLRYQHTSRFDDFYERRARRHGTYFTREDIERGGRNTVFELMSSAPGVIVGTRPGGAPYVRVARCVGSSLRATGHSSLALFVNGQRIRGEVLEVLAEFKAADVETMEVYRGPTQLPMEAMGDACAAVFITTRFTTGSVLTNK